jgi:hypothetical protein
MVLVSWLVARDGERALETWRGAVGSLGCIALVKSA